MIQCSVRIDRRYSPIVSGTWDANQTDVHVFQLDRATGSVKDFNDAIVASGKCSLPTFELVALPQCIVLGNYNATLSSLSTQSQPNNLDADCALYCIHCILTPVSEDEVEDYG
jgi:hypothetical protein